MKRTDFPDWGKDLGQRLKDTEESLPEDFFSETMDLIHRRRNRRRIVISLLSSAAALIVAASLGGLWSRDELPARDAPRQLPGGTDLVAQSTPEKEPAPDLHTLADKGSGSAETRDRRAPRKESRSTPDRTPQPSTSGESRGEVTNPDARKPRPPLRAESEGRKARTEASGAKAPPRYLKDQRTYRPECVCPSSGHSTSAPVPVDRLKTPPGICPCPRMARLWSPTCRHVSPD